MFEEVSIIEMEELGFERRDIIFFRIRGNDKSIEVGIVYMKTESGVFENVFMECFWCFL